MRSRFVFCVAIFVVGVSLVALVSIIGVDFGGGARAPAAQQTIEREAARDARPRPIMAEADYESLIARGFTREETKPILLERFEQEALDAMDSAGRDYWQPGNAFRIDHALRVLEAHERVRGRLLEVYGPEAREDAAFRRLFRPLDPWFAFLSSEQQIAVQRLRLERQREMRSALEQLPGMMAEGAASGSRVPAGVDEATRAFRAELERVLGEAALFEYRLRDSPLAQRLRRSGVEFSEAEFRETYRLLQQLESAGVSREQLLSVREQLRRTLGSRRFAALWATRDPRFSAVQSVGREHDLTEATILSAYEILNDAQDRMVEIVGFASRDAQRAARETQAVRAEQRRRLASLGARRSPTTC